MESNGQNISRSTISGIMGMLGEIACHCSLCESQQGIPKVPRIKSQWSVEVSEREMPAIERFHKILEVRGSEIRFVVNARIF